MSDTKKPRIFIIYTGGTIGMVENAQNQLVPFDFSHLIDNVPKIGKLNYEIGNYQFPATHRLEQHESHLLGPDCEGYRRQL